MKRQKLRFTPGPWKVYNGWDDTGKGRYFPSVVIKKNGNDPWMSKRIIINESHDQEAASIMGNATIIAAAPVMLEALQYYEEALDYLFKKLNFGASALDAKAIDYMNQMGIKGKRAIALATTWPEIVEL